MGKAVRKFCRVQRWRYGATIVWAHELRPGDRMLLPDGRTTRVSTVFTSWWYPDRLVRGVDSTGKPWVCVYHRQARVRLAPTTKGHHR